jgi:predicted dehydrogenase
VLSTADIGMAKVTPAIQAGRNCEVVAIASRNADRARAAADQLDIPRAYGGYEDLLADAEVDAVYVPLPNQLHAQWTMAAARAGKHVLCEKPLALTAADAQEMVDVCAAEGVKFMEAFMYRLHPSWLQVRELVAEGRIGELRVVQAWFSYFNDDPDNIRNKVECGGGALMDIGCYPINAARMLFGREPTAVAGALRRDPRFGTDVVTSALLEFGPGQASFTCSTQMEDYQRVHIGGTEGRIDVEIPFNIPPDRPTRIFVAAGGNPPVAPDTETITFDPRNQYTAEAEGFAAAVLDDTPVPTPPEDGVANMRVIEQIVAAGS